MIPQNFFLTQQSGFFVNVKSGKSYKKIFETPLFSSCGIVDNNGEMHASFKIIMDQLKCSTPLFYKCPYNGKYEFLNFSVKGDGGFAIYPAGTYNIGISFASNKNKVDLARISNVIGFKLKKNWKSCNLNKNK